MRKFSARFLSGALCAAALTLFAAPAQGAFDDPLSNFDPFVPTSPAGPPPAGYLNSPCGLTVAPRGGDFYVSDYYHRSVDVFSSFPEYVSQPLTAFSGAISPHTGLMDDPCGLALDAAGTIYVNNYHRNVVRFPSPTSLGTGTVLDSGDPSDNGINPQASPSTSPQATSTSTIAPT